MQNFKIYYDGYKPPEQPTKWRYPVGAFVVAVKELTEPFTVQVRTA